MVSICLAEGKRESSPFTAFNCGLSKMCDNEAYSHVGMLELDHKEG